MMKRTHARATLVLTVAALAAVVALVPNAATAQETTLPEPIDIEVSPETIDLQSPRAKGIVHAEIPYDQVSSAELWLGEESCYIPTWKAEADDCGNYVAVFVIDNINDCDDDDVTIGAFNTFRLTGYYYPDAETNEPAPFKGEQAVKIINGDDGSSVPPGVHNHKHE